MSSQIQIREDDFVLGFSSPQDFFILASNYQSIILDEFDILISNGHNYESLMNMPTYIRKDFIKKLINKHEKSKNETNGSKGNQGIKR